MKKITEFEGHLSLQVEALQAALRPTAPKSTTLPADAPLTPTPLDKRWLEATQLSLPLDVELPTFLKECLDQRLYQDEELAWLWQTGQALKLESILGFPIVMPVFKNYRFLN
jgi:hypothetical protein